MGEGMGPQVQFVVGLGQGRRDLRGGGKLVAPDERTRIRGILLKKEGESTRSGARDFPN